MLDTGFFLFDLEFGFLLRVGDLDFGFLRRLDLAAELPAMCSERNKMTYFVHKAFRKWTRNCGVFFSNQRTTLELTAEIVRRFFGVSVEYDKSLLGGNEPLSHN